MINPVSMKKFIFSTLLASAAFTTAGLTTSCEKEDVPDIQGIVPYYPTVNIDAKLDSATIDSLYRDTKNKLDSLLNNNNK